MINSDKSGLPDPETLQKEVGEDGIFDAGMWKDAFKEVFDKDFIVETLKKLTPSEAKGYMDLFLKMEKSTLEGRQSILQESLYGKPKFQDLGKTLIVCKAEIRRLREQLFIQRSTVDALLSMAQGHTKHPEIWLVLLRVIQNINRFYKRYHENKKITPVSPKQWIEVIANHLRFEGHDQEKVDKDWDEWEFLEPELKKPETLFYDPVTIARAWGVVKELCYDESDQETIEKQIKGLDPNAYPGRDQTDEGDSDFFKTTEEPLAESGSSVEEIYGW